MTSTRHTACRLSLAASLFLAAVAPAALAQPSGSPFEPEIQGLTLEAKLDAANIKPLPPDFATVLAGAELRLRIDNWAPRLRTCRFSMFLVAPGAPIPTTQLPEVTAGTLIVQAVLRIESINYVVRGDGPAVALTGRVTQKLGGVGEIDPSEVVVVSFSFPANTFGTAPVPIEARNLTVVTAGDFVFWAPTAVGSLLVFPAQVSGRP